MEEPEEEDDIPEGMERILVDDELLIIHKREKCAGEFCPVHNASDHHMRTWRLHWRDDQQIFERICFHGVGHPDPDTIAFLKRTAGEDFGGIAAVHGCDGCCTSPKAAN